MGHHRNCKGCPRKILVPQPRNKRMKNYIQIRRWIDHHEDDEGENDEIHEDGDEIAVGKDWHLSLFKGVQRHGCSFRNLAENEEHA